MAAFCRFWRISPSEYKQLTLAETRAFTDFAEDEIRAQKRAQEKARSSGGRR